MMKGSGAWTEIIAVDDDNDIGADWCKYNRSKTTTPKISKLFLGDYGIFQWFWWADDGHGDGDDCNSLWSPEVRVIHSVEILYPHDQPPILILFQN